ncbi:MAG TPA: hypothetical protein DEF39_12720 [Hungateiclostridium thermocellum]|jgi:uncharacterized membrane protein YoaT (DUF817 family)|uniref:Uncharacterized protein n=1 Tax=Acetivibrio thermocellus AD2 TaxID=1138384 RepID=A0AB36TKD2_ACETH|nr:hypothetical protein [Acetivibrio thermocellus]CDG36411.1 hypothetical protein CTHBC1_1788 [Acetivibrio thermocellus BC1]ADU75569.1 hypothetical protein Clo1313_2565 [Acetivibrio thermocellus DSM 1313]ALX09560.1 hypothetical protein AD2_02578 [Acetivibrio thermocellus AD2]ANV77332.1 hypothetical protein LQRI_2591 [Acetivibrio thermocellus DSM 2360]EIC04453.1 hypothetical protein YSBL_1869 [Acetivibrio thermocellus YS]
MKKIMSALCMLIAVILMALPFGVPMTFAPGPKERVVRYFSYFSMVPVGYGNWFPIITAFLSVIIVLLLLAGMKKVNTGNTVEILLIICIISQLLLWLLFNSVSAVGVCVMVLHIIVFILQMFQKRKLGK